MKVTALLYAPLPAAVTAAVVDSTPNGFVINRRIVRNMGKDPAQTFSHDSRNLNALAFARLRNLIEQGKPTQ